MSLILENNILSLSVEEPGKLYQSSRFDWTGNISQIIFDKKFSFCSAETIAGFKSDQHGQGLYNEFGINKPVGYDDCPVGGKFPKIGIGLLTKGSSDAYDFFQAYEIKPFSVQTDRGEEWLQFIVFPVDCRGYSAKLTKRIVLSGNSFSILYELENTGICRIHTHEYVHNFIAINQSAPDKNYTLRIPGRILKPSSMSESVNPEHAVVLNENTLSFRFTPGSDYFFSPLAEFGSRNGEWEITHDGMGVGLREITDFVPEMMNLWGSKHVISPELFVSINLDPGQLFRWRRTYMFYYL